MKTHVIDGVTYVEVDRKAKYGDKVLVLGKVYPATIDGEVRFFNGVDGYFYPEYKVLEPIETEASPDVTDLLANLARRVASLEDQLRSTQRNLETTAEDLANTRHRLAKHADRFAAVEDKVEMLTDDIVTLDSRSQVLNAINKYYAEGLR